MRYGEATVEVGSRGRDGREQFGLFGDVVLAVRFEEVRLVGAAHGHVVDEQIDLEIIIL